MPLVRALARLNESRKLRGRLRVVSYGSMDPKHVEAIRAAGLEDVFLVRNTVPYLESLALMRRCDCLLLIDAKLTSTAESVFLPSKLVDYLGARRPVVALTPTAGTSARVVAEVGGMTCDVEDEASIEKLFARLIDDRWLPAAPDANAVAAYDHLETARLFVQMMQRVL